MSEFYPAPETRPSFVGAVTAKLIEAWPAGASCDDVLGFIVGVTELAFPPAEEEPAIEARPATLAMTTEGGIEGALQLHPGGVNTAELPPAGIEPGDGVRRLLVAENLADAGYPSEEEADELEAGDADAAQQPALREGGGRRCGLDRGAGCAAALPAGGSDADALARGRAAFPGPDAGGALSAGDRAEEKEQVVFRRDRALPERGQRLGELARRGDLR